MCYRLREKNKNQQPFIPAEKEFVHLPPIAFNPCLMTGQGKPNTIMTLKNQSAHVT